MKRADRALVKPNMQSLLDKVNEVIKEHEGLEGSPPACPNSSHIVCH